VLGNKAKYVISQGLEWLTGDLISITAAFEGRACISTDTDGFASANRIYEAHKIYEPGIDSPSLMMNLLWQIMVTGSIRE